MSDVTLTAPMRANLLSLQNTAQLLATTQQRLATGKKVNSALDNPTSYFASQALTDRANDLSNLLDGMGQAIQTITAATQGITAAESVITQMQAVATSASQSVSSSNATSTTSLVANSVVGASQGTSAFIGTNDSTTNFLSLTSTGGTAPIGIQMGDSMTVKLATGNTYTFTVGASNANNGTLANGGGSTVSDLTTWLAGIKDGGGNGITLADDGNAAGVLQISNHDSGAVTVGGDLWTEMHGTGETVNANAAGTALTTGLANISISGQSLASASTLLSTITNNTNGGMLQTAGLGGTSYGIDGGTLTFTGTGIPGGTAKVTLSASDTVGTLLAKINGVGNGITATLNSATGGIQWANASGASVTVGGTASGILASTAVNETVAAGSQSAAVVLSVGYTAQSNPTLGSLPSSTGTRPVNGDQLFVTVGSSTSAYTFAATDTINTVLSKLNGVSGVSATYNSSTGALQVTGTGGQAISLTGSLAQKLNMGSSGASSASVSQNYQNQYDTLRTQLDQLVQDASYQGINLIAGGSNKLTVQFNNNASNPNSLTVNSVDMTSSGLGLTAASGNWTSGASITASLTALTNANTTLRTQASNLGTNLTTVQTRQTFTNNLINTLQSGAGNLTNADTNTESANMLALQTQQQLGISSLSLASQAAQSVLKLFP